jgi:hypothetical protein
MFDSQFEARPRHPDEFREIEQLLPVLPGQDTLERVRAGDEVQLGGRVLLAEVAKGVHRVRQFLAVDIDATDRESRVGRGGDDRHEVTVLGRADDLALLLPRRPGRDEDDLVETEGVGDLAGGDEVAVMDRIERSAHHSQLADRHRLLLHDCRAYFAGPGLQITPAVAARRCRPTARRNGTRTC